MTGLYVTHNGEKIKDGPDRYIILYMAAESKEQVEKFLIDNNLENKFEVYMAKIQVQFEGEEDSSLDGIETLVLCMKDDRVLFEYRLSGKHLNIMERIHNHIYGRD